MIYKQYSILDLLTDMGGFSKTIGVVTGLLSGYLLKRHLNKKLRKADVEYEQVISYERIIYLSNKVE